MPPAGLSSAVLPAVCPALHPDSDGHCSDCPADRSGSDHLSGHPADHSCPGRSDHSDSDHSAGCPADRSGSDRSGSADSAGSAADPEASSLHR